MEIDDLGVARALEAMRKERGWSKVLLAERARLGRKTISKMLLHGESLTTENLGRVLAAFETDLADLSARIEGDSQVRDGAGQSALGPDRSVLDLLAELKRERDDAREEVARLRDQLRRVGDEDLADDKWTWALEQVREHEQRAAALRDELDELRSALERQIPGETLEKLRRQHYAEAVEVGEEMWGGRIDYALEILPDNLKREFLMRLGTTVSEPEKPERAQHDQGAAGRKG